MPAYRAALLLAASLGVLGESNQIDGDRNPAATAEELSWLKAAPCVGFHSADDVQFAKSRGIGCAIRVGIGVANAQTPAVPLPSGYTLVWNQDFTSDYTTKTALLKFKSVNEIAHAYDPVLYVDHDILFFEEVFLEKVNLEDFPVRAVYDLAEISGLANRSLSAPAGRKQERPIFLYDGDCGFFNATVISLYDTPARFLALGRVIPKLIRGYCYSVISCFRRQIPGLGKNGCRSLDADERARFLRP